VAAAPSEEGRVPELTEEVARWLVTEEGLAAVSDATAALDAGAAELTIGTRLRAADAPVERATAVLAAACARRRARTRWPDADQLLFTRQGLEQASDPEVSRWRARRLASAEVWDLCAGIGGDTLAIAEVAESTTAVDNDPGRLVLLGHNADTRRRSVVKRTADASAVRPPSAALVHADPSRRDGDRRVRRLADHRPAVGALIDHLRSRVAGLGVVLSPAVDLHDPDLPADAELEFVQVDGRLVEAVAWLGATRNPGVASTATLLPAGQTRTRGPRPPRLPVGPVGTHLVEVAPAAVRARLHDDIGAEIDARRLAARRALLTVDGPPPPSPWYTAREVEAVLPARPAAVRRWLKQADERPVEVAVHGLEADPRRWWQDLGRPPRGPAGRRVELVRTDAGGAAVVTVAAPQGMP
jgi:hypothetical protein